MNLLDVNVLVYAHRSDTADHDRYRDWLELELNGAAPVGISELALSGFLRVVTHPRVFVDPTSPREAFDQASTVLDAPAVVKVRAGDRHWSVFDQLARTVGARGNDVADAYHAALAIEHGATWITTDRGFTRFPGLRVEHPLDAG